MSSAAKGTYTIGFETLTVECIIGINDSERVTPQPLIIDLHARLRKSKDSETDVTDDGRCQDDTKTAIVINYSALAAHCRRTVVEGRFGLLETAAKRIADGVANEYGQQVEWVRVHLRKPKALPDAVATVSYEVAM
ncbi:Dihydroneopterin aldolase [Pandoravirus kuranda]|uniref:dihydroneopterin aldolase n=2 Tax=Pandoravirus TaxID=2060084 RepID=A0AA95J3C5_9VIRU|nr:Dihydroneopterin aldolase [Pandoravirus neocaledonia]AVK75654.1 Dihydroneopterin aldolase [Pandoravirus neocaledonia]WBR14217.1 Dihydroneopterin aldolase [Pandoravirus kuranda]